MGALNVPHRIVLRVLVHGTKHIGKAHSLCTDHVPVVTRRYHSLTQERRFNSSHFVLQIMDRSRQLSKCAELDDVLPIFKVSDGTFGDPGLARKKLSGKLFRFGSDFV